MNDREPVSSREQLLARVLVALEDLSFKCFGGICLVAPPVETYNRTFLVLDEARQALGVKVAREYRPSDETGKRACECKGVCAMAALVPFYCTGTVKTSAGSR